jgi:sialic acid synthase SpsE/sugar phosphate isomerase/epimerase/CBS domain-containing protein
MIIQTAISSFSVIEDDPIEIALHKLNENKSRVVFVIDRQGILLGSLTDGDFRRWSLESLNHNITNICSEAMNRNCVRIGQSEISSASEKLFSSKILVLPVVDNRNRLIAVAKPRTSDFHIDERLISDSSPAYVIAEIGINHNGSIETAKKLVDAAKGTGADAAKFQLRDMDSLYRTSTSSNSEDLGVEYTLDLLENSSLTVEEMIEVFEYAKEVGITPLCTPWDQKSALILQDFGISGFKIASADLTNHALISLIAQSGSPIILSTGMSSELEIIEAVNVLKAGVSPFALLHCNSTYPAPFADIRLEYLSRLKQIGDCVVGYSGHERGHHVAIAAVALGARIIEKHISLDRNSLGNDHKVSLEPSEFKKMVLEIRELEMALTSSGEREISQGERMNRLTLAKSLVAARDLPVGHVVSESDIDVRSPGRGLQPNARNLLIGKTLRRSLSKSDFFFDTDINPPSVLARDYEFSKPWGLPVRFHDFQDLLRQSNPDFLEFHLSYRDMDIEIENIGLETLDMDYIVHSPDLFLNDHILDLASEDTEIYERSIFEVQRVVDFTRNLKNKFLKSERPKIVISMGGSSLDVPWTIQQRNKGYARLQNALSRIDDDGVELLAQTLPPFPWYLGGQRFCNLFVDPNEIANFSKESGVAVCLDISHTKLACNYLNISFAEAIEIIGPHARHLHLVDAIGHSEEGVQIGEGDVDWHLLCQQLNRLNHDVSFIPEIWQGHVDNGQGFWIALDRLEKFFNHPDNDQV